MKRNRVLIESSIGKISAYSLTKFIMKLKAEIHRLARKRKRKKKNEESKHYNQVFRKNQSIVFNEFKDIIKENKDEEHPIFKKINRSRKYFEKPDEVLNFWKNLWNKDDPGRPDAEWLNEYETLFLEIIPELNVDELPISNEIIWNGIKKKRNWSSPGPDLVVNFWWKKINATHDVIGNIFRGIINNECNIEGWYTQGRTALLEKDGDWTPSNTRPITCTNNLYKWFSSVTFNYSIHI